MGVPQPPQLKLPSESSKGRNKHFYQWSFSFSEKQGWPQPLQKSEDSKSGHQRETELETSQSLLLQHLTTQRSAELGGKQLRVFGTLCLGLISCVISSSPFFPLPSAPFPCLFLSGKEQLYQSIQYKISLFPLPRASVPDIWENAAFWVKRHQYTVFIATASDSGALDRNTKAILDHFFEQRN